MDDFCYESKSTHATTKLTSLAVSMNGTQRKTLISLLRMHCVRCSMPKGALWAEATLNSELKINPVALAIVELRCSEGIG